MSRKRILGEIWLDALLDNWAWGLSLVVLRMAIHVTGITFLMSVLHSFRVRLGSWSLGLPYVIPIVVVAFTTMDLLFIALPGTRPSRCDFEVRLARPWRRRSGQVL